MNASLGGGGAERQFVALVRALCEAGIPPETLHCGFFSLESERGIDRFLPDLEMLGVPIHDMGRHQPVNPHLPREAARVIEALPFHFRHDVRALWHLLAEVGPDTVHGWQDRAGLAAAVAGELRDIDRIVISARNMAPDTRRDRRLIGFRPLYADAIARGNVTFTANARLAAQDYARWLDRDAKDILLLQNGIDTGRFTPELRRRRGEGDAPLRIGGVFRLAANKRPLLWLDSLAALRDRHDVAFRPVIRGEGPMTEEVRAHAERIGLGDLTIEAGLSAPAELYGDLDVVLLTSRVEGLPNVLLEAQACGLPVAACDVGGVRDAVLAHGRAAGLILAPDAGAVEIADAMAEWLPGAGQAPVTPRVNFVRRRFGLAAMAASAVPLYLGQPARAEVA